MAQISKRLKQNVPGEFWVDSSCIDCDTCRRIAPGVFERDDDAAMSYVHAQPNGNGETERSLMALVACPTASIGTENHLNVRPGIDAFPEDWGDGVHFCGFTSQASFGAWSYLIQRPGGNVLVDSPRAAVPLIRRLKDLGGVRYMFLTHQDDVADHAKFAEVFGCERIIHEADVRRGTRDVERKISGEDPIPLDDDLLMIPVPGHTRGSTALLYRRRILFSGDHLWWSYRREQLIASQSVCWYSWPEQIRSVQKLIRFPFRRIYPGHGMKFATETVGDMHEALRQLVQWMRP